MLLKNCRIVKDDKIIEGDILIDENGKIKKIAKNIKVDDETIDIKNSLVIPGVIDAHVHFRWGEKEKEDFSTGSLAGINGGVCFAIDMPNNKPPITTKELFYKKLEDSKKDSKINIFFNFGITEKNYLENVKEAKAYKIFMVKSVGDLYINDYSKLKDILNQNKLFCIHAEHKDVINENIEKYPLDSWIDHCKIRDEKSEVEAVKEVIKNLKIIDKLEKYKPHIHFCHISTKKALYIIKEAKHELKNIKITVEATPHHIYLNKDMAEELKGFGKFNPPLREKEDNIALIKGIINKDIDIIASDHAPHLLEDKLKDVRNCPSGIPGIETIVPLTLNLVNKKLITLFDAVRVLSKNPAKIFDINNKIEEGNLTNLTIIDLKKEGKINAELFKSKAKFSPFDGWEVKGFPIYTVVNGTLYESYGFYY
ncbi:dihydroorotase [Methanocaldococcus bathoardescens]|uniref:Dihydroorotase n=1 Tax=Methanocaldococcus bathoardescens TaxID=1301915 RepID=A0A076LI47_9EURY|nr:dihydroorotase [Methanocaldococcus bathoardescens]AIJ05194.1 dihydroorotase [Methanocaldococcus bathoardescens]